MADVFKQHDVEAFQRRILRLSTLGYVIVRKGQWALTEKGWRTLSAAAEEPLPKPPKFDKGKEHA